VVGLGAAGLWQLARRPAGRSVALFLLACVLLAVPILTDAALWNRFWGLAAPRYVLVSYGSLAVAGALVSGRGIDLAWLALIASGLLASFPGSFGTQGWLATIELLAIAAICALAAAWGLRGRSRPRRERLVGAALTAVALLVGFASWRALRERQRYAFYEAAAAQRSWDLTPLGYAQSWPVWQALDDGRAHRLAVVAGWDGIGHNWFQYPLFGSRLQNTLLYVSPTLDGSPLHYGQVSDPWSRAASASQWMARLAAADVDVVVLLPPAPTVEASFVRAHPDRFAPLVCSADGEGCADRFERAPDPQGP